MGTQYMTPGTGLPLVIETPMGMIDIRWDVTRRRKRLVVTLPDGIKVHRGEARAMSQLQFLKRRDDGELVPAYDLLAPAVDADGRIKGVRRPQRLCIRPVAKEG